MSDTTIVRLDSPIFNGSLSLKRTPKYLRFVLAGHWHCAKNWDALDQIDDEPKPGEKVFACALINRGTVHLDRVVKGKRVGEWHQTATYDVVKDQPSDDVLRSAEKWREWCLAQDAGTESTP